jgi:hypothetical protein
MKLTNTNQLFRERAIDIVNNSGHPEKDNIIEYINHIYSKPNQHVTSISVNSNICSCEWVNEEGYMEKYIHIGAVMRNNK